MCTAAINLTSKALNDVTNAEVLLKIKGFISLFIQTMEVSQSSAVIVVYKLILTGLVVFCVYARYVLAKAF